MSVFKKIITTLLYTLPFYFIVSPVERYILFVVGALLALLLLMLDEQWLFQFYQEEHAGSGQQGQQGQGGQERERWRSQSGPAPQQSSFSDRAQAAPRLSRQPQYLVTRSALFMLVLIPLSIFVLTSSSSPLGVGLVLGLVLNLLLEMSACRHLPQVFKLRFLSDLKLEPTQALVSRVFWAGLGFFVILNLLVLI
jgi:hypothetical protein